MSAPSLPEGFEVLRAWLTGLERDVELLKEPKQPTRIYACAKADLPSAAGFIGCIVRVTDGAINILVHSDGTNWRREDTGAIV